MSQETPDTADVIAKPPLLFGGTLAASLVAQLTRSAPLLPRPLRSLRRKAGVALIAGGFVIGGWGYRTMRAAGNDVSPHEPVQVLVTGGAFEHTRNPMYLAMTGMYLGITLLLNNLWGVLLLPGLLAVVQRGVIDREEAYLRRRFGDAYIVYSERVPRWL
jgi:protein-S-isoprenylcysteine O-methyltransferase Ste14